MSEQSSQPSPQHQIRISYYAILYMDVLNQREKLALIDDLPSNAAEEERFFGLLRDTYGVVDGFARLFDAALLMDRETSLGNVSEEHRQRLNQILGPKIQRFLFSDSMLYFMPLDEQEGTIPTLRLDDLMSAAANVFIGGLADGSATRGGLEIGIAANFPRMGIYGPALYKAYELENNIAQYPRVVIGSEFHEYLIASFEDPSNTEDGVLRRRYARKCLDLIYQDNDGVLALDYAGEAVRKKYPGLGPLIISAMEFAQSELARFQREHNDKLIERYTLLVSYLSDRVQRFWS
jgi:hypothetical protein